MIVLYSAHPYTDLIRYDFYSVIVGEVSGKCNNKKMKPDGLELLNYNRDFNFECNCGANIDIINSNLYCYSCGYTAKIVNVKIMMTLIKQSFDRR